ncbi:hypothetical protein SLEP1_g26606 [Rubroshorea leprosula]|uniref:Uncharacterized protein n=1 Tax=Rubroshorea leprosula TaxID=152421 RepID=A0AAV5JME2_9ROSI|nr:hypothetical protein SLEP1_g26606 [Rubroshorea leprosula]
MLSIDLSFFQGSEDAAVDEPMDWDKFPPVDDWLASKSGEIAVSQSISANQHKVIYNRG